jgi:hypothetical protein
VAEAQVGELGEPRLLELVRDGNPIYARPFERRHVWRKPDMPFAVRLLERATRTRCESSDRDDAGPRSPG